MFYIYIYKYRINWILIYSFFYISALVDEHNDDTDHHQRTNTEENAQKVDTKDKHLMSTPTLKTDFQTYVNKRFIKECYLFHQLIMKKYNLTHHIHDYTDEELFSCLE